jgi:hypothetical protein
MARTGDGTYVPQDTEQFADSGGCSYEVAMAIFELTGEERSADDIWADPTKQEYIAIRDRAFELASDEDSLQWGGPIRRDTARF